MINSHHLKVQRTARYYTVGQANPNTKYLWIVCHGYGQLAKHFIRKFDAISGEDVLILAPEGLSRFYWDGVSGEVVASWMTKEDRLNEISDYTEMINGLYEKYKAQCADDVKVILFGFSQGCATQVRWLMNKLPDFHALILWAGLLPEDIDYRPQNEYLSGKLLFFTYGSKDIYLTEERQYEHKKLIEQNRLSVVEKMFEGPHKVVRSVLKEVAGEVYELIRAK